MAFRLHHVDAMVLRDHHGGTIVAPLRRHGDTIVLQAHLGGPIARQRGVMVFPVYYGGTMGAPYS